MEGVILQEIYYGFEAVWTICKIVALFGGIYAVAVLADTFLHKKV